MAITCQLPGGTIIPTQNLQTKSHVLDSLEIPSDKTTSMKIPPINKRAGNGPLRKAASMYLPRGERLDFVGERTVKSLIASFPEVYVAKRVPRNPRTPHTVGFCAAKEGNERDLKRALDGGLNVNAVDSSKFTLLMTAARTGSIPTVHLLLDHGANPNMAGSFHVPTPLIIATKHGYSAIVLLLLQYRANPNKPDNKMQSPILYSAANGHADITHMLLKFGANAHWIARAHGSRPLGLEGKTAIHCAARYGHERVVEMLLQKGVGVNVRDEQGRTCTFWAAQRGHVAVLRTLLAYRAKVDIPDMDGATPLMWASRNAHLPVINLLIGYGANVSYRAPHGETALTWAFEHGDSEIIEIIRTKDEFRPWGGLLECCGW